ncbi:unnamed protein product [Brassica oleracea var. botrytis]|uniref:Uncharacterized protein n=2 Tax=Brassica TaxID=3705 RepID=A0A3P6DIF0_BRAOL|nr:unnamed protein product [Brassica napus]CDY28538.1 BnaC02g36220D [Brassica napus]VDD26158.1 unnamed protein product [Brassica oleracea]
MEYTLTNKLNISKDDHQWVEEPDLLAILTLWFGLVGAALLLQR